MAQTVLLFGDQSDGFVDGIDYICKQAEHQAWLRSFLADTSTVLHDEMKHWEHTLRELLGNFKTVQELSDQFRHRGDDSGLAHGLLVFIMRQSLLLQCVKREPALIDGSETISVCGGFLNAAALDVAKDFDTVYEASLELLRVLCRLERLAYNRARATDLSKGSWACAVTGISADKLQTALDKFQRSTGTPEIKKVRIAVVGQGWSTIIGPPTTLSRVLQQCPALKSLPKRDLSIRGPFHTLNLSDAEFDGLLGSSSLLDLPAGSGLWKSTVKTACEHVLTRPFDLSEAVRDLDSQLGSIQHVDLDVIGTSSHANSIVNQLKATGKQVTIRHEHSTDAASRGAMPDDLGKIAIVGMAGKAPGADDLDDFWQINIMGRDLHKRIPEDRFDVEEFYSATHNGICSTSAQFGCFIDRPGGFDARFFNVSHREALLMEPCHRQWLMSVYEALEMAGYSQDRTRLTDPHRIGAFFGQSVGDWRATTHPRGCNSYDLPGTQRAFGPGRVNYHFKWEGPSYNVDSACASSASAITLACQNLLLREIDMAVAGGANVISSPHAFSELSRAGVLSMTGNCKPFRDDADGYCRSEFSGAVVLKRVEDAVAANDNILAVIAASARNSSGNATSIITSDAGAQQRLFRQVLGKAHIAPEEVAYVEMHGTGTQVGDLAEMTAVTNTFKRGDRHNNDRLNVGSLKANIGHSEGAAGVASLLKCILSLQKEVLPPVANMPHKLNPNFPDLNASSIDIPASSVQFRSSKDRKRRMVLNNFDASGGNTCLLVEDFAKVNPKTADPRSCHVITISAKSAASHIEGQKKLLHFLRTSSDACRFEDLAYTTTARRIHYPFRTAIAASSTQQVINQLDTNIKDNTSAVRATAPPIVFMFTGQGSHYAGMGAALYKTSNVFRDTIDLCVTVCNQHGFSNFLEIITDPSVDLPSKTTMQTQLALVCLEIALATFWQANGIEPALVMGHSVGEYAAFYVAGVLSLVDVLYLVGRRAQLVHERCEQHTCSMLSVIASPDQVSDYLKKIPSCEVACLNSPKATVVSGAAKEISLLQEEFKKDGFRSQILSVPYAFHSSQMDGVLDDFATLARDVTYCPPRIPIASTLSAAIVEKQDIVNQTYLVCQTREKVDYVGGLDAAIEKLGNPVFLEIGPRPVLGHFVRDRSPPTPERVMSTLDSVNKDWSSICKTLALLYSFGVDIDWTAFHQPYTEHVRLITLPTYSWDLKDYWLKWTELRGGWATVATLESSKPEMTAPISSTLHFVDTQSTSPSLRFTFRSNAGNPYLKAMIKGHRLRTVPVCPGGVYCEIGMEAARYALKSRGDERTEFAVKNASFNRPFTMPQGESTADIITTITMPNDMIYATFAVNNNTIGQCHYKAVEKSARQSLWAKTSYFIKARMDEVVKSATSGEGHRFKSSVFYSLFSRCLDYDSAYEAIKEAYVSTDFNEAVAEVILQEDPSGPNSSSPYWTDSLVHLAGFVANANPSRPLDSTFVTNGFEESLQTVEFHPGGRYFSYVRVAKSDKDTLTCDVFVFDSTDTLVMQCSNLQFRNIDNASLERILGKVNAGHIAPSKPTKVNAGPIAPPEPTKVTKKPSSSPSKGGSVLDTLLGSIATETGTDVVELTDDAVLSELGVDSIMAMQVVATVKKTTGFDVPSAFLFQYPTIGSIRKEFADTKEHGANDPKSDVQEEVEEVMSSASQEPPESRSNVLVSLLQSISDETGTEKSDLTDDALLSELGCDSIMALQIASTVKKETGYDLEGSFVFDYPSIGNLRKAFGEPDRAQKSIGNLRKAFGEPDRAQKTHRQDEEAKEIRGSNSESKTVPQTRSVTATEAPAAAVHDDEESSNSSTRKPSHVNSKEENEDEEPLDFADIPEAKIILMQGKSSSKEIPLFLMSDGFGTAATYIHLPRFKSGLPVYAIESPFIRCPGKLTRKAGIPAIAKFAVDAMIKARPKGPYLLGGFSGGATISYEICRQLAATGRKLQGLMLIDMCCPREMDESTDAMAKEGLPLVQRLSPPVQQSTAATQKQTKFGPIHLKQVVRVVCNYKPPPLTPQDRPALSCLIWAQRGLIERARTDSQALSILSDMNIQTEVAEGFMTDVKLGPAAWSVPSKTGIDLGCNGWDEFLGEDIKVIVADADHLSMPVPPDVGHLPPTPASSLQN
ncbi:MAG: polyketide synthase pks13 [Chrysothrix sp. TS-e1954]|nr:MAG: polyketide synthase pks13 [Chrysothrix sp. TS-e1954]